MTGNVTWAASGPHGTTRLISCPGFAEGSSGSAGDPLAAWMALTRGTVKESSTGAVTWFPAASARTAGATVSR